MSATPSPNGFNGRRSNGQFAKGNPGGPGNPHGRRTATLRAKLLDYLTDDDILTIFSKLIEKAKSGDLRAIREVLDRTIGKPNSAAEMLEYEAAVCEPDDLLAVRTANEMVKELLHHPDYHHYRTYMELVERGEAPPLVPWVKGLEESDADAVRIIRESPGESSADPSFNGRPRLSADR